MYVAKNTTGLTENGKKIKENTLKARIGSINIFQKINRIKALCFTQTDNTTDAVVCFLPPRQNHNHKKTTQHMSSLDCPWASFLAKTDKIYQRAIAVCT